MGPVLEKTTHNAGESSSDTATDDKTAGMGKYFTVVQLNIGKSSSHQSSILMPVKTTNTQKEEKKTK